MAQKQIMDRNQISMTEQQVDVPHEGEITIAPEVENDNSQSSSDETNEGEETQSTEGEDENTQSDTDKDTPFHEHPRWKEREADWNKKFNDQETRHQDDLKAIREEFGQARKDNAEEKEIPSWFGGDQTQWNAYRKDRDAEIKAAENRVVEQFKNAKSSEDKAIEEATAYMNAEIASIEGDKTLNPDGKKIDPNKLLKIVMDNDLVDSKGRWNYKAGYRLMKGTSTTVKPTSDRKKIAGATTSESGGEPKPKAFRTGEDFRQNRPW